MRLTSLGFGAGALLSVFALTCKTENLPAGLHLADDLAAAFCQHQLDCCSPAELGEVAQGRYTTEAECLPFARLAAEQQLAVLENAIVSGHIVVDGTAAAACVRAYAQRACNTSQVAPEMVDQLPNIAQALAACPGLMEGRVPAGGHCEIAEECMPGTRCSGGGTAVGTGAGGFGGGFIAPAAANGACIAVARLGGACNETADCDPRDNLTCRKPGFVCGRRAKLNEPCGFDPQTGGPTIECDFTQKLVCDFNQNVCRRAPGKDEPCDELMFPPCDPDPTLALSCNPVTRVCKAPGQEGADCGGLANPPCRFDLACIPTQSDGIGACGPVPGEGSPCTDKCVSPAACDASTRTCKRPGSKPLGTPCASADECVTLTCSAIFSATTVCSTSGRPIICAGGGVTPGTRTGFAGAGGGFGGFSGFGGFGAFGGFGPAGRSGGAGSAGVGFGGFGGGDGAGTGGFAGDSSGTGGLGSGASGGAAGAGMGGAGGMTGSPGSAGGSGTI